MVLAGCEGMPQVDFQKVFVAPRDEPVLPERIAPNRSLDLASGRTLLLRPRLNSSEWANISFATFALTGGLFCAFYFFNGTDLLRAAAQWSREFLYPRPSDAATITAKASLPAANDSNRQNIASSKPNSDSNGPSERNTWPNAVGPRPELGFLAPISNGANGSSLPGLPSIPPPVPGPPPTFGGTLFSQLNTLATGPDALFLALYQTVTPPNSASVALKTKITRHTNRVTVAARKKVLTTTQSTTRQTGSTARSTIQNGPKSVNSVQSTISSTGTGAAGSSINSGSNLGGATGLGGISNGLNGVSSGLGGTAGGLGRSAGLGLGGGGRAGR
jgi:hypothetical protein